MRIYPVIKRVVEVSGGAASWLQGVKPAVAVSTVNTGTLERPIIEPALAVAELGAKTLRIPTNPAVAVSLLPVVAESVKPVVGAALGQTFRNTLAIAKVDEPAFDIAQIVYALNRLVGGNAQAAVGTAWTNPPNAINGTDGKHNASSATCAGSVGGNTNGIELSYLDHVLKEELAITAARLDVYAAGVDLSGLLLSTVVSYNIGGGLVTLETIAGAFSNLTTPRSYTIPVTTWTQYNALQVRVVCTFAALSAAANASLDAIEIAMTASKTDNP